MYNITFPVVGPRADDVTSAESLSTRALFSPPKHLKTPSYNRPPHWGVWNQRLQISPRWQASLIFHQTISENEWRILRRLPGDLSTQDSLISLATKSVTFPVFSPAVLLLLPVGTASVERSFYTMKRILNRERCRLLPEHTGQLMQTAIEGLRLPSHDEDWNELVHVRLTSVIGLDAGASCCWNIWGAREMSRPDDGGTLKLHIFKHFCKLKIKWSHLQCRQCTYD